MPRHTLYSYVDGADLEDVAEMLDARLPSLSLAGTGSPVLPPSSIRDTARRHARSREICRCGTWASIWSCQPQTPSRLVGLQTLRQSHSFWECCTESMVVILPSALQTPRLTSPRTYSTSRQIRQTWSSCEPSLELEMSSRTQASMRCSERRWAFAVASGAPRGRRR